MFQAHADEVLTVLSQPTSSITGLESASSIDVSTERKLLSKPTVSAFDDELSTDGFTCSIHVTDETYTAHLVVTKQFSNFELSVAVEPESNRSYAILESSGEKTTSETVSSSTTADGAVLIEPANDDVTTNACAEGNACKPTTQHIPGAPDDPACMIFSVYCCFDSNSCYWGTDNGQVCNCPACPHCEDVCGYGNYC